MKRPVKTIMKMLSVSSAIVLAGCVSAPKMPESSSIETAGLYSQIYKKFDNLPDYYYLPLADMYVLGKSYELLKKRRGSTQAYVDENNKKYASKDGVIVPLHSDTPLLRRAGSQFAKSVVLSPFSQSSIKSFTNSESVQVFMSKYGYDKTLVVSGLCFDSATDVKFGEVQNGTLSRISKVNLINNILKSEQADMAQLKDSYEALLTDNLSVSSVEITEYVDFCLLQDHEISKALSKGIKSYNSSLRSQEYKKWPIEAKRFYGKISMQVKNSFAPKRR